MLSGHCQACLPMHWHLHSSWLSLTWHLVHCSIDSVPQGCDGSAWSFAKKGGILDWTSPRSLDIIDTMKTKGILPATPQKVMVAVRRFSVPPLPFLSTQNCSIPCSRLADKGTSGLHLHQLLSYILSEWESGPLLCGTCRFSDFFLWFFQ